MNKIYALLALALLVACAPDTGRQADSAPPADSTLPPLPPAPSVRDGLAIGPDYVGPFRLGMPEADARAQVVPERLHSLPRQASDPDAWATRYEVHDSAGRPALRLAIGADGLLAAVEVISSAYNTPEGLGVGSTLDEIRAEYPDLRYTAQAGDALVLATPDRRYAFWLDISQTDISPSSDITAESLPGSLVVVQLVLRLSIP